MINDTTYTLIKAMTDGCVEQHHLETAFGNYLHAASEDDRAEVAYLIHDLLNRHPDTTRSIPLYRVEQYIAQRLKIANWHVKKQHLDDELAEICEDLENEMGLFDDSL
jgi:hypothetical protein